jgi:hypothetical protein
VCVCLAGPAAVVFRVAWMCLTLIAAQCGTAGFALVVLQVVYEDGSSEELFMGLQRVRLLVSAGEQLARPDAATLLHLSTK